jgi:transcriptional antiterminator
MNIRIFIRLHELIKTKQTGTPMQLAQKLEISERSIHYYISFMRNEMKAPIVYDRKTETYCYETECNISFKAL